MAEPLGIGETLDVVARLGAVADEIILIGGQALNFWAEHYKNHPSLRLLQGGIASKDIDFCGTQQHVQLCALALAGRAQYQSTKALSRCVGVVHYLDAQRNERALDILSAPYGLQGERLWDKSYPATLTTHDGRSARLRVMHPLHCLISRTANVADLSAYQNERGIKQLRAAIACMRAHLEDQLDRGEVKAATRQSEALFTFCVKSTYAQITFVRDGIEAFDAMVCDHERLPAKFRTVRYPQMKEHVARCRAGRSQQETHQRIQYEVVFVGAREQRPFLRLRSAEGAEVEVPCPSGLGVAKGSRVELDERGTLRVLPRARGRGLER